jgi:hypothetical protein
LISTRLAALDGVEGFPASVARHEPPTDVPPALIRQHGQVADPMFILAAQDAVGRLRRD